MLSNMRGGEGPAMERQRSRMTEWWREAGEEKDKTDGLQVTGSIFTSSAVACLQDFKMYFIKDEKNKLYRWH